MSIKGTTNIDLEVGRRISALRKAAGMSLTTLGATVGVTFQQIQKYESGRNRVSGSRLDAIAKALGCAVADLFPPAESAADTSEGRELVFRMLSDTHGLRVARALMSATTFEAREAIAGVVEAVASKFPGPTAAVNA